MASPRAAGSRGHAASRFAAATARQDMFSDRVFRKRREVVVIARSDSDAGQIAVDFFFLLGWGKSSDIYGLMLHISLYPF